MDINSTTAGNLIKNYNKCSIEIKQEICDDVDVIPNSETEPIVIEKCEFCHEGIIQLIIYIFEIIRRIVNLLYL